jgi:hypothetical protein
MPDIAMCLHKECELKDKCYRYIAEPHEFRQSYSTFDYPKLGKECSYFMEADVKDYENKD